MIHDGPAIHPLANVDLQTCSFGDGSFIWQFASVIRGAQIGQCCTIGAGAIVDGAKVGDRSLVGAGAQLHPGTIIHEMVFVGPGAIFCNDFWPTAIKEGFERPENGRATIIAEDGASIGAGCIILPGVIIGKGAMVAAGVVCDRSIPAGHILRRDGSVELLPEDRFSRRMKWAI